jgi:hypothetical protein
MEPNSLHVLEIERDQLAFERTLLAVERIFLVHPTNAYLYTLKITYNIRQTYIIVCQCSEDF